MKILQNLTEGVFSNGIANSENSKSSSSTTKYETGEIKQAKAKCLRQWLNLSNYWMRWKKLYKEHESNFTQEMNELEQKAYEQYRIIPQNLKDHFMEINNG